jgi:hypothetical protein
MRGTPITEGVSLLQKNASHQWRSDSSESPGGSRRITCRPKRKPAFLLIIVRYFYLQQKSVNVLCLGVPKFISL